MLLVCGTLTFNSSAILLLNAKNSTVLLDGICSSALTKVVVLPLPATAEIIAFSVPFLIKLKIKLKLKLKWIKKIDN